MDSNKTDIENEYSTSRIAPEKKAYGRMLKLSEPAEKMSRGISVKEKAPKQYQKSHSELEDFDNIRITEVKETQTRLITFLDNIPDLAWFKDVKSHFLIVNKAFAKNCGKPIEEIIGKLESEIWPAEFSNRYAETDIELIESKSTLTFDEVIPDSSGKEVEYEIRKSPVLDSDGNIMGIVCIARDITRRKQTEKTIREAHNFLERKVRERTTKLNKLNKALRDEIAERKKTEKALQVSEERLKLALEGSNEGLWDWNVAKDRLYFSPFWLKMLGYNPGEIDGSFEALKEKIHPEDLPGVLEDLELHLSGVTEMYESEYRIKTKSGRWLWMQNRGKAVIRDDNGRAVRLTGTQINSTVRKRIEQALKDSEELYRSLVETSPDAIVLLDTEGNFIMANHQTAMLLEFENVGELLFHSQNAFSFIPEDQLDDLNQYVDEVFRNGSTVHKETWLKQKNDKRVPVEISLKRMDDENGAAKAFLSIIRDITKRKQTFEELQQVNEQLLQAQKMEAVGQLAGSIAHDFNNYLTIISGRSDLMMKKLAPTDAMFKNICEIHRASGCAADLTRRLLTFSHRHSPKPMTFRLNDLIQDRSNMLNRLIGENNELIIELEKELWNIRADPNLIENALFNLVINAKDALGRKGRIIIRTANCVLDAALSQSHSELSPGSYVMLSVEDNGSGIKEEIKSKLFEPFFTTKEQGKGTGLGLSTVYGTVKQSEGHIQVESEEGKGSNFIIYFPKISGEVELIEEEILTGEQLEGKESLLVVEDDKGVREVTVAFLKELGYKVLEATDGVEALQLCSEMKHPVDLVITDLVMPNMGGVELVENLKKIWPDVNLMFMSGYPMDSSFQESIKDYNIPYLQKPFLINSLASLVRETLDK